ncbi:MAG: tRNA (5-methylaminomethyl-2-thiouridine)(34)-methyltransferase MnmD [Flavobacteriaceae bacterium]|nr:tRNA (5-methylaminomethyl-2-thiouridine)(34)-methyltransferase MnmD [Flavobacteriaceae bacterium]
MNREIITTEDGSTTIHLPEWDEQYHSKHGAIQEAYHVFIEMGFFYFLKNNKPNPLKILEIGFGTGLNTFITLIETHKIKIKVNYTGIEAYPITSNEIEKLNYSIELKASKEMFNKLHTSSWEEQSSITTDFKLLKRKQFFSEIEDKDSFHLIYFDAFGARVQPELWTVEIFQKMYNALKEGGVLVTYSAKGSVRRAMQEVGFTVERLPGAPGKREMLRGTKHSR